MKYCHMKREKQPREGTIVPWLWLKIQVQQITVELFVSVPLFWEVGRGLPPNPKTILVDILTSTSVQMGPRPPWLACAGVRAWKRWHITIEKMTNFSQLYRQTLFRFRESQKNERPRTGEMTKLPFSGAHKLDGQQSDRKHCNFQSGHWTQPEE